MKEYCGYASIHGESENYIIGFISEQTKKSYYFSLREVSRIYRALGKTERMVIQFKRGEKIDVEANLGEFILQNWLGRLRTTEFFGDDKQEDDQANSEARKTP
jgi:hypothetical protein